MYKIACFIQNISNTLPKIYNIYNTLVDTHLVESGIIYTDKCSLLLNTNFAIFSTYYIRENFTQNFILVDYNDIKYLPLYLHKKCIILYDESLPDNISRQCYISIKYSDNIKETLNAKL
jgi:hypothetical protein